MPQSRPRVTIVIPCFNQLKYTRLCVESVCRHTTAPYELVLIDNGSRDGTKRYVLQEVRRLLKDAKTPPLRYVPVINPVNAGVAAAINQGIGLSRGNYVCYLNNDTIVTPFWLEHMLRCAARDAKTGIVGCVTNLVKSAGDGFPDRPGLRGVREIERTGLVIGLKNRGQYADAPFVHGFCMLIKSSVIRKIGLFDENFYPCAGEDIDYSYRAKLAGFKLVNAGDAFVFHFWSKATRSRRFDRLYTGIASVKRRVRDVFVGKWGAAGERFLRETRVLKIARSAAR